jgi:hypothetical protein
MYDLFASETAQASSSWEWTPVLVATISAGAAIVAAVIAAVSARGSRRAQEQSQRIRDLENRLADKKYPVYEPMMNTLGRLLVPGGANALDTNEAQAEFKKTIGNFATWISIYGSDEAVDRYHKFMQGAFSGAPPKVTIRLYAELIRAARRDMGHPDTDVTLAELMGMRITDIHREDWSYVLSLSEDALFEKEIWTPPWHRE